MKIAILGLPQSGKRTLFKLLTGREISPGRKPDESVEGIAQIRDERVDRLTAMFDPEKTAYAENNFVLCPDLQEGSGSIEWLSAARRCDLLCLLVRSFEDEQVYHPAGSVDPERDRESIEAELLLADMQIIEKRLDRIAKEKKSGLSSDQAREEDILGRCMESLEADTPIRDLDLKEHEFASIKSLELITAIPVLAVYNVAEESLGDSASDKLCVSCQIEQEIADIEDDAERKEFMESLGITTSGLDRVNASAYDALGLMSYYTVGTDECRAWTIRKGSTAPVAGGKIHSDIERGFIRVEVIKYDDLIEIGSEQKAKEQGKMQLNGKDYIMEDGDICHFLFNV